MQFHYNVYGAFRSPREDVKLAKLAADAGFEGVWIGEHFHPWIESRPYAHHAFSWLSTVLAEVSDVEVGTSVCCPAYRFEPPVLAQMIATLDQLHPGRFNFGIGVGEAVNEAAFLDESWPDWRERASRVVESLDVMDTLWNHEGYIDYEGDDYCYNDISLVNKPTRAIDIHWAAWGPLSSKFAGRYAGNIITPAHPDHVSTTVIPNFHEGLTDSNRTKNESIVSVEMKANYGEVDSLVAEVRDRGEYVPAATELDNPDPRSVQRIANEKLDGLSDDEVVEATHISDDPEYFVDKILEYQDVGVDRMIIGSTCGDPGHTISMFKNHVFPAFK